MKDSNRKSKRLAITLMVIGLFGLSLAVASQLVLNWNGNFQQGVVKVEADCQTSEIAVNFGAPIFKANENLPWTVENLKFSSIDTTCNALNYKVAIKTDTNWQELTTNGTIDGTDITIDELDGVTPELITEIALTIYGD